MPDSVYNPVWKVGFYQGDGVNSADLRIVSLIPSATEIVAALGYGDYLVGRSHECDYPAAVTELPICTEPKFDPVGTSGEIHERVTELLASALSVYRVKTDVLATLKPTHIITQAQCEVCAVSLSDVEQAVTRLVGENSVDANNSESPIKESPIEIVSLQPACLADVWTDMARVAEALGRSTESQTSAETVISQLKARLPVVNQRPPDKQPDEIPTVVCIEWTDPLMAAGNWVPELVTLAGGHDCLGKAGAHSDWTNWETLVATDPDILIVMPCGYDMAETHKATVEMAAHEAWTQLKAVKNGRVYLTDGNQYFNRPGPRLVESWEILAEIIQGKLVNANRSSKGWQAFSQTAN